MALGRRRPPQGLLHHSDRGSQYARTDYQDALTAHGIVCSMSRRGNCWDNAVAESFFATLKVELGHDDQPWLTRAHAQSEVFEYIEGFYNGRRRHSTLGYLSPLTFERQWAATAAGASRPLEGLPFQQPSSVKAPGSTRRRGVAISISPQCTFFAPITELAGIVEARSRLPAEPMCSAS